MFFNQPRVQTKKFVAVRRSTPWRKNASKQSSRSLKKTRVGNLTPGATPITNDGISSIIPGANYIFDSNRGFLNKIFWFSIVTCSIVICSYQTFDRFQLFLSNPIATRISITRNESVKFPSITICRPYLSKVPTYPRLRQKSKSGQDCKKEPFELLPEFNLTTIWQLVNIEGLIFNDAILAMKDFSRNMGNELNKTNALTMFGSCSTYAIKKPLPFKGEYLVKFLLETESAQNPCNELDRAQFLFHHDDEDVTYVSWTDYNTLAVNSTVRYALSAKHFSLVNRKDAPCDSVAVVSECKKKCLEGSFKSALKCRLPIINSSEIPLCTTYNTTDKTRDSVINLIRELPYMENCKCPKICEEILYYYSRHNSGRESFDIISYFFEDNVIIQIEEYYSYTVIPFLCEVGGNLGLFLGLCIPAIIELLQSVMVNLYYKTLNPMYK